jgi:restriction system protein
VGRNRGFTRSLVEIQKEAERQARARAAAETRAARQAEQARRKSERARAATDKERKQLYRASRTADVGLQNARLEDQVACLQLLLADSLAVNDALDFELLKERAQVPVFNPGDLTTPIPPPDPDRFKPRPLTGLQMKLPGRRARYEQELEEGRRYYEQALALQQQREAERLRLLRDAQAEHAGRVSDTRARLAQQHAEVDAFKAAFAAGERTAVLEYFRLVLERSSSSSPTSRRTTSW